MQRRITGVEIVASLSENRQWWRLQAGDVEPWVQSLHRSAVQDRVDRTQSLGSAWDGRSDIQVGRAVVRGSDVAHMLRNLRRGIRDAGLGVAQPCSSSVRRCYGIMGSTELLVFDIDLGDMILPIGICEWQLRDPGRPSTSEIARSMLSIIRHAVSTRRRLVRRELRLRSALEETAAGVGPGVAPLWLRMCPFPIDERPADMNAWPYLMWIVSLDQCLEWAPVIDASISTVNDIRGYRRSLGRDHRSRTRTLERLVANGSQGSIDEVSLAIITAQGLNPGEAFRLARHEALTGYGEGIPPACPEMPQNGMRTVRLHYRNGRLEIVAGFDGGVYVSGNLLIWGDFPETMSHAARGRRLDQFVDHPTLRATGMVVTSAETRPGVLDLTHRLRLIPIEEAERRWNASTENARPRG